MTARLAYSTRTPDAPPHTPLSRRGLRRMHDVARTVRPTLTPTREERTLLAIFGLRPGETVDMAIASMRDKPAPQYLSRTSANIGCVLCAREGVWHQDLHQDADGNLVG